MTKEELLARCRCYKGEKRCPEDVFFFGWECEEMYVRDMLAGDLADINSAVDFFCSLGLDNIPELKDGTPIEIQALLFERYCYQSDNDPETLAGYFLKFYKREWPSINHRKIYVASSWRNLYYPDVVAKLREAGYDVYDFRNPPSGDPGFKWSSVSEDYMEWSPEKYREMLNHPKAERQFHNDIEAMEACDTCVLVLPCGRSAHTEAGWFAGRGCTTIAYIPERQEPELMYKLFSKVVCSMDELIEALK